VREYLELLYTYLLPSKFLCFKKRFHLPYNSNANDAGAFSSKESLYFSRHRGVLCFKEVGFLGVELM